MRWLHYSLNIKKMSKFKTQVTDRLMEVIWLFENVLGRFSEDVGYNQRKELAKKMLCDVYGYKDIYKVVKPELDAESMNQFMKTVFTYYDSRDQWTTTIRQQ